MTRESGRVKWFSNEKGYGFIERGNGEDLFVHHSDIEGEGFKTLRAGEEVEFDVVPAQKGPKAERVMRRADAGEALDPSAPGGGDGRASATGRRDETAEGEAAGKDRQRTLAEQLREKLGRRFFGG